MATSNGSGKHAQDIPPPDAGFDLEARGPMTFKA
jgi:hypothetical protein